MAEKNRHFFLTVRELEKSKVKVQVPGEGSSWFADDQLLAVSSLGGEQERALVSLPLIRALIPS